MVSLLLLGVVIKFNLISGEKKAIGAVMAAVGVSAIVWGVFQSKKETPGLMDEEAK